MGDNAAQPEWLDAQINGLQGRRKPISPPSYDGSTDVRKFLQTFGEVCETNGWDEDERALQLKLTLQGTALDCLQGDNIEGMVESLLNRFQLTREEARRELRNLKLSAGQDIHQFAAQVIKLVRMAEPELDVEQLDERATDELIDAIGDKLLTREFRLQGPINFADAVRRIQQYYSDMRVSKLNRFGVTGEDEDRVTALEKRMDKLEADVKQGFQKLDGDNTDLKETVNKMANDLAELVSKQGNATQKVPPTRYLCKKVGHVARECRAGSRPSGTWGGPITCFQCGRTGHIARNCRSQQAPAPQDTYPSMSQDARRASN